MSSARYLTCFGILFAVGYALGAPLPMSYIRATDALRGSVIGDPRGGQFCQVEVQTYEPESGAEKRTAGYGWVLSGRKRAVFTDGFLYHVVRVLGPADVTKIFNTRAKGLEYQIAGEFWNPILPALLNRAGHMWLAERAFEIVRPDDRDILVYLQARTEGQVAGALSARRDAVALTWAKRRVALDTVGIKPRAPMRSSLMDPRVVMRDIERRVAHPKSRPDWKQIAQLPEKQRIATILESLDELTPQIRMGGSPFWDVELITDALGSDASEFIPVLIDRYESDTRLTRSIPSRWNELTPSQNDVRYILSRMIAKIWPSVGAINAKHPSTRAAEMRTRWSQVAKLTEPERYLLILKDDRANSDSWQVAAGYLTSGKPMRGEPMRNTQGPVISKLLALRADQMQQQFIATQNAQVLSDMLAITVSLATWDRGSSLESLRKAASILIDTPQSIITSLGTYYHVARIVSHLAELEDPASVTLFRALEPGLGDDFGHWEDYLYPVWKHRSYQPMVEAGDRAIEGIANRLLNSEPFNKFSAARITEVSNTELISLPKIREIFGRFLNDDRELGMISWSKQGEKSYEIKLRLDDGVWGTNLSAKPTGQVTADSPIRCTFSDFVAYRLPDIFNKPVWNPFGSPQEKATQRAKLKKWLRNDAIDWNNLPRRGPIFREYFD